MNAFKLLSLTAAACAAAIFISEINPDQNKTDQKLPQSELIASNKAQVHEPSQRYFFQLNENNLCVYSESVTGELIQSIKLDITVLPEAQKQKLKTGFYIEGKENALEIIEDYTS